MSSQWFPLDDYGTYRTPEEMASIERARARRDAHALAPCLHPLSESVCIGTPAAQNLWRCKACGKEWVR